MGYLETGCPDSTLKKQLRDHKKLNRLSKDSIDFTRFSKNERVFRGLAMKSMLSVFSINVAGDTMECRCMHKEAGIYKNCLLERAVIPLYVPATKPDLVYNLIHMLLTFRTAIACTVRKIMHNSDDTADTMSIISESSNMSISSQGSTVSTITSPPRSPYRPSISSLNPPRRKKFKVNKK